MVQLRHIFFLLVLILSIQSITAQKVATTDDEIALLLAVEDKDYFVFESTFKKNISPNITDEYGISLLMYAVKRKSSKIITDLLNAGADPNYRIKIQKKDKDNRSSIRMLFLQQSSVLDFAVDTRDTTIVEQILKAGAKINPKEAILSPLKKASENKDYKMLYFLSKKGAKVSKKTGRDFLLLALNRNTSYSYSSMNSKDSDDMMCLLKFWEEQGIDISIENFEKSSYFKNNRRFPNKRYYTQKIDQYEQWSAKHSTNKDEKIIRSAAYADYIDPEYEVKEKAKKDSLFEVSVNNIEKTLKQRQQEIDEQEERENTSRMMFLYVSAGVLGIMLYVYIKHGSLKANVWISILQNIFNKQPQQRNQNQNQNQNQNNNNQNTTSPPRSRQRQTAPKPKTQDKPAEKPKPAPKPRSTAASNNKGWTVDSTTTIQVDFLTIEDMINPIRLCNEYEKAIRKMMWYMRRLENHTDEQIMQVLGEEGLLPHLDTLWKNIKTTYVRDIYKRSLYLMVENYQTRDERVSIFLDVILKKRPRGNKPKKKSEKEAEKS